MKLGFCRIGRQESAAVTGIAVYTATVLAMDSQQAYGSGNSTYIWMPLAIIASLCMVLFITGTMQRCGVQRLDELLVGGLGGVLGRVAALPLILLFILSAFFILTDFVNMIHSFVFYDSGYWEIACWVLLTALLLGFMGLECISRTALLILPLFALSLLAALIIPCKSYALYRLFPFPGNSLGEMGGLVLHNLLRTFGGMAALLTVGDRLSDAGFAKSACLIAALCAAAMTALTQFAMALAYEYIDLADMFFPLYRIEMIMTQEGYFFRMDKLALFFWLMAGIVSAAYYIYAGSVLWCRCFGSDDTRPGVATFAVMIGCAIVLQSAGYYTEFRRLYYTVGELGWAVAALPVAAAVLLRIRHRAGKGRTA